MNNTCFGPVYPFEEAFRWAMGQDVDFWGLTYGLKSDWNHSNEYLHYNKDIKHIQSYFLVLRRNLLGSEFIKNSFGKFLRIPGTLIQLLCTNMLFLDILKSTDTKGLFIVMIRISIIRSYTIRWGS